MRIVVGLVDKAEPITVHQVEDELLPHILEALNDKNVSFMSFGTEESMVLINKDRIEQLGIYRR